MLGALRDEGGQGLAEYGILLGFVAVLCISAVAFFGQQLLGRYTDIGTSYP
ncbi:MAG TPA: hypothetical protein VGX96_11675 [Candidatus Elarobacter sp.]|jgi:Flp pilus assembly pilin Flp|nr:hypothetical protein [Candidatus Elarobacter sp.]